jgi:hypothetical protein
MHDPEKSDSAVVAAKPPNKAGSPAAEAVEPRAGTKGNADQQSTHRTLTRGRVTQALNRVRSLFLCLAACRLSAAVPSPWPGHADKKSHSGQTFAQPIAELLIRAQA